jgi:hypothetical protein
LIGIVMDKKYNNFELERLWKVERKNNKKIGH